MIVEVFADGTGQCQTHIRVDIDLADSHAGRLAKLFLGNTDGIRHIAAVLVDHLNILRSHRGSAVQNNGETRQTAGDLLQNIKAELGLRAGLKLVAP